MFIGDKVYPFVINWDTETNRNDNTTMFYYHISETSMVACNITIYLNNLQFNHDVGYI